MPQETEISEGGIQALYDAGIKTESPTDTLGTSRLTPEGTWRPVNQSPAVITSQSVEDQTTKNIQQQQGDVRSATQGGWYRTKEGTTIYVGDPSMNKDLVAGAQYLGMKKPSEDEEKNIDAEMLKSLSGDEQEDLKAGMASADSQIEQINGQLDSILTGQDELLRQQLEYLKSKYEARRNQMRDINQRKYAAQQQIGIRTGGQRYDPIGEGNILGVEEVAGMARIAEIDADERAEIAAAQQALAKNKWELLSDKRDRIEKLREEKADLLKEQVKLGLEREKKIREEEIKFSRDNAIAGIVAQGITDPLQILNFINYDESGRLIGDVTSEEVANTLSNLLPKAKETGDYVFPKDKIEKLIGGGLDFGSIQSIQDDINEYGLTTVLEGLTDPKQKALVESLFALEVPKEKGARNLITISEARSLGLPISLVGKSQDEIIQSLSLTTPPDWFREVMEQQSQMSFRPEILAEEWSKFREEITSQFEGEGGSSGGSGDYGSFNLPPPVE